LQSRGVPETSAACFDDATAALYLAGDLSASEVARVDSHIDTCATCRRHLSELARQKTHDASTKTKRG
jgi:anti-sigma factor RsiW